MGLTWRRIWEHEGRLVLKISVDARQYRRNIMGMLFLLNRWPLLPRKERIVEGLKLVSPGVQKGIRRWQVVENMNLPQVKRAYSLQACEIELFLRRAVLFLPCGAWSMFFGVCQEEYKTHESG